jgi:hypothetical protein
MPSLPMETRLPPGHKLLLRCVPATLAVIALIAACSAEASYRPLAGSSCGKLRAPGWQQRAHLRCRLRPNTAVSPNSTAAVTAGSAASFKFFSTQALSRFQCRIDRRVWRTCRSPTSYAGLDLGPHRFSVRAVGRNGLIDLTPATIGFEVASEPRESPDRGIDSSGEDGPVGADAPALPTEPPIVPSTEPPIADGGAPFASAGVWAEPLPLSAPIDPDSPQLIDTLTVRIQKEEEDGIGPRLGADTRTPLYRVGAEQPRLPVFLDTGPWGNRLAEKLAAGVPIPSDAKPVAGSDRSMAIWQASTDVYWEFFKMEQALHGPQFARAPKVSEGCSLQAGAYSYEVTAFNAEGETAVEGGRTRATVAGGACITIQWGPIHGAAGYKVYRGRDGVAETYLETVPAGQSYFLDNGTSETTGVLPPSKGAAVTSGEWHAAHSGMVQGASESPGYYRDLVDTDGTVREQANWGAAATSLPLAAGLITKEDVERGSIDHALAIGLANRSGSSIIRAGSFASPAQRSDGKSIDSDSIPEGARLRLDPSLDLGSLPLSPFARMLATAAQRYGMIVQDGSQSTVVYAEDPAPMMREGQPNFLEASFGLHLSRAVGELPWGDLEVVRMHLCQHSPCLP